MRRIGALTDEADALRFREYLALRGIEARLRPEGGEWPVWILDEDQLAEASAELEAFRSAPQDARYVEAEREAQALREARLEEALAEQRETIVERRRRPRTAWRQFPITLLVIVLCGMATAAIRFGQNETMLARLQISLRQAAESGGVGLYEIRGGEVWRVLTPSLLHFDVLQLVGNVSWLYLFGRVLEQTRTRRRYAMLLILIAAVSNVAQYYVTGPQFGGLSGVICGLFGYLWFKSHFRPEAGFQLPPVHVVLFAGWMLICVTDQFGPIANTAHLTGLILGIVLATPRSTPVFR